MELHLETAMRNWESIFAQPLTAVTAISRVWVFESTVPSFAVNVTVRVSTLGFSELSS